MRACTLYGLAFCTLVVLTAMNAMVTFLMAPGDSKLHIRAEREYSTLGHICVTPCYLIPRLNQHTSATTSLSYGHFLILPQSCSPSRTQHITQSSAWTHGRNGRRTPQKASASCASAPRVEPSPSRCTTSSTAFDSCATHLPLGITAI